MTHQPLKILVLDVGGTHIKIQATGHKTFIEIPSGPKMTPRKMVADVRKAIAGWEYSVAAIGYPGPVLHGKPVADPHNLGRSAVPSRSSTTQPCKPSATTKEGACCFLAWARASARR